MNAEEWHVRSNGLNFIIMDQSCNVIAECSREADAKLIVNMHEQNGRKPQRLTCFCCRDGDTPLYCLNCAGDALKHRAAYWERRSGRWVDVVLHMRKTIRELDAECCANLERDDGEIDCATVRDMCRHALKSAPGDINPETATTRCTKCGYIFSNIANQCPECRTQH